MERRCFLKSDTFGFRQHILLTCVILGNLHQLLEPLFSYLKTWVHTNYLTFIYNIYLEHFQCTGHWSSFGWISE